MAAMKAPGSANLDRVQIVKGWTKNGEVFERVYDVVWSGDRTPDENAGKLSAAGNTVGVCHRQHFQRALSEWRSADYAPCRPWFEDSLIPTIGMCVFHVSKAA